MRADAATLEPALQRTLMLRRETVYRHLANLLIEAGRLREAQRVIELLKSEEFLAFMRGVAQERSHPIESLDYTEREKAWSERLEGVATTREAYQKALRDLSIDLDAEENMARGGNVLPSDESGASMRDFGTGVVAVHMLVAADRVRCWYRAAMAWYCGTRWFPSNRWRTPYSSCARLSRTLERMRDQPRGSSMTLRSRQSRT